jgi:hypothetical protein
MARFDLTTHMILSSHCSQVPICLRKLLFQLTSDLGLDNISRHTDTATLTTDAGGNVLIFTNAQISGETDE